MKVHEWLEVVSSGEENIPERLASTRPTEFIILVKVLDVDGDIALVHWRSDGLSFWEALGMVENYKYRIHSQTETSNGGDEEDTDE